MKFSTIRAALAIAAFASATHVVRAAVSEFPDSYYFYDEKRPDKLRAMEGKPAPELTLSGWIGEQQNLEDLKGKVVVVDFWATWCGPCMKAIPHNIKMFKEHEDDGLMIIGVHDSRRGSEKMAAVAKEHKINYPLAVDVDGQSTKAYNVPFWPTYVVLDRKGVVRAAGLKPDRVETVVAKLLEEEAAAPAAPAAPAKPDGASASAAMTAAAAAMFAAAPIPDEIPAAWLERDPKKDERISKVLALESPPEIKSETWINSEALSLGSLEGKVVMLDFWATWCGPCLAAVPKTNELMAKYGEKGLVIVGVCHPKGVEKMGDTAKDKGIKYPICADADGKMIEAYGVDSFPDYYFIDRAGKLRIADCKNNEIENAIKMLLDEKP